MLVLLRADGLADLGRGDGPQLAAVGVAGHAAGETSEPRRRTRRDAVTAEDPHRLILAGGLTPENVGEAIDCVKPWGVDVASGVEGDLPGRKDPAKVRAFVQAVRGLDRNASRATGDGH